MAMKQINTPAAKQQFEHVVMTDERHSEVPATSPVIPQKTSRGSFITGKRFLHGEQLCE